MASQAVLTKPHPAGLTRVFLVRCCTVAAIVLLWEGISRSGYFFQGAIPPILDILRAAGAMLADPVFYRMLAVTAYEVALALLIGGLGGLVLGLTFGIVVFAREAFEPYVYYLGTTPKIILMPLVIMWFGIGMGSKVAIGAISCLIPILLGTSAAVRTISQIYVKVGKSFHLSPAQLIWHIYLPATRVSIINSFRIGFGISMVGVLLAETKLSSAGLGFQVMEYYRKYDMPSMYALVIIICFGAAIINGVLTQSGQRQTAA